MFSLLYFFTFCKRFSWLYFWIYWVSQIPTIGRNQNRNSLVLIIRVFDYRNLYSKLIYDISILLGCLDQYFICVVITLEYVDNVILIEMVEEFIEKLRLEI